MIRRPQPRCKCGHARKNHVHGYLTVDDKLTMIDKWFECGFCYKKCPEFIQDNLATLERLYAYKKSLKVSV